jgi:hypothetical protein
VFCTTINWKTVPKQETLDLTRVLCFIRLIFVPYFGKKSFFGNVE